MLFLQTVVLMLTSKHLDEKIFKANKGIGIIRSLYNHLPNKSFIHPHLDNCDIIYHKRISDEFFRE